MNGKCGEVCMLPDYVKKLKPPMWALLLVMRECTKPSVTLDWGTGSHDYTSGMAHQYGKTYVEGGRPVYRTNGPCIRITAGKHSSDAEQRSTVLHEIAHINVGCHHMHGDAWLKEVVRLYRKHGLLDYAARNARYAVERRACQKAINRSARGAR